MQRDNDLLIKIEAEQYITFKSKVIDKDFIGLNLETITDSEELDVISFNVTINQSGINKKFNKVIFRKYFENNIFNESVSQNHKKQLEMGSSILIQKDIKKDFEKVSIDKIREIFFDDIINDIDSSSLIRVDVSANYHLVFDFWWEDLFLLNENMKETPIHVIRNYIYNKEVEEINSDIALFFFSRAKNSHQGNLISSAKKELANFWENLLNSGLDIKRSIIINNFQLKFLSQDSFDNAEQSCYIFHVSGHGSKNGDFAFEDVDIEKSSNSVCNIDRQNFSKKFMNKSINILNLAFCYSCYNDNPEKKSLPVLIFEFGKNIKYIVSSKTEIKPNIFNDIFYKNLLQSGNNIEQSFFRAVEGISEYKKSFSLFKISSKN